MHRIKQPIKAKLKIFSGAFSLPAFLIFFLFLPACGKKDPPTLREFEKPVPPTALQAIHREEKILLSWQYPAGREDNIADFIILKSSDSIFRELVHLEKSRRAFEDADFETGRTYLYKVMARNTRGVYSSESNTLTVIPLAPPPPPSGLSYSVKDNSVLLSWKPVEENIFYNVYRRFENEDYGITPFNSTPLSESQFKDILNINNPIYYTVRSFRTPGQRSEGAPSAELAVLPSELIPAQPQNVKSYPAPGRIFIAWDQPEEPWVTGFRIYRRTAGSDYQLIGETQIPVFVDAEPAPGLSDYRVNAVGPSKEGPGTEIRRISVPK
jgi:hypothetical protein